MIAILGGLGAATVFATATLCSSRSARMIGASPVLAWVMMLGFLIVVPWAAVEGMPDGLDAASVGWLVVAGLGNVLGLLLAYSALRIGKVGVVAPVVSTEGAIAAVISVIAGEQIARGVGLTLAVIAVGIVLAAATREGEALSAQGIDWAVGLYAIGAAVSFGLSLYATARVSAELPVVWALLPARVVGVLAVAVPLALTSRLRLTRRALPLVVTSGIAEVAGFFLFAIGSRHGIAVTAVLASQFGAIAGVAAFLLFRERLRMVQIIGVAMIVSGVSVLSVLQT
ncbi:MAG: DMT family transporter [Actinomycetota bacterium]|nr:DMT family transporter [Actinomycetota bacterium]